jgi:hypothetical protein
VLEGRLAVLDHSEGSSRHVSRPRFPIWTTFSSPLMAAERATWRPTCIMLLIRNR